MLQCINCDRRFGSVLLDGNCEWNVVRGSGATLSPNRPLLAAVMAIDGLQKVLCCGKKNVWSDLWFDRNDLVVDN